MKALKLISALSWVLLASSVQAGQPLLRWTTTDARNAHERFECTVDTDGTIRLVRGGASYGPVKSKILTARARLMIQEAAQSQIRNDFEIDPSVKTLNPTYYQVFARGSTEFIGYTQDGSPVTLHSIQGVRRSSDGHPVQRHQSRYATNRTLVYHETQLACGKALEAALRK